MFFVISLINKISVFLDCLDNSIVIEAYSVQLNNVVHQQRPDGLASRKDFWLSDQGRLQVCTLATHTVSIGTVQLAVNEWGKKRQRQQKMLKQKQFLGERIGHQWSSVFFFMETNIFMQVRKAAVNQISDLLCDATQQNRLSLRKPQYLVR